MSKIASASRIRRDAAYREAGVRRLKEVWGDQLTFNITAVYIYLRKVMIPDREKWAIILATRLPNGHIRGNDVNFILAVYEMARERWGLS